MIARIFFRFRLFWFAKRRFFIGILHYKFSFLLCKVFFLLDFKLLFILNWYFKWRLLFNRVNRGECLRFYWLKMLLDGSFRIEKIEYFIRAWLLLIWSDVPCGRSSMNWFFGNNIFTRHRLSNFKTIFPIGKIIVSFGRCSKVDTTFHFSICMTVFFSKIKIFFER